MAAGILPAAHAHKWRDSPLVTPVVLYGACLLPSLIVTRCLPISMFGHPGVYSGSVLTFLLCATGLLLAEQLEEGRAFVQGAILCAGSATVLICLMQRAHMDPLRLGPLGVRALGFQGSPIDVGALLVVLVTFAPRALVPAYAAALWSTVSRGAWVGALVALTPKRFRVAAFAVAVAAGLCVAFARPTDTDRGRHAIWGVAASHLSFFGSGPATFNLTWLDANWHGAYTGEALNPAHAHNSILDALSTRGVFGLLGLVALLWAPELAGLWTICMFNPVSFEVTFIACVLAGLSRSPK